MKIQALAVLILLYSSIPLPAFATTSGENSCPKALTPEQLSEKKGDILSKWEESIRALTATPPALQGEAQIAFDYLVQALTHGTPAEKFKFQHAEMKTFSVHQVVLEYQHFRNVVLDHLAAHPEADKKSFDTVIRFIDEAILDAALVATRIYEATEESLALLKDLPKEERPDLPLKDAAEILLSAVQLNLRAKAASCLIFGNDRSLAVGACVGLSRRNRGKLLKALEESDFIHSKDFLEQPVPVESMDFSEETRRALRQEGIRSVLAMKLSFSDGFQGALFISYRRKKALRPLEQKKLRFGGERLASVLQNGLLYKKSTDEVQRTKQETENIKFNITAIAHDLRSPLSAIRIAATMLVRNTNRVPHYASRINSNVENLDRLITDFLDAMRLQAGEPLPLNIQHFDIKTLVQEYVEEHGAEHGDKLVFNDVEADAWGFWSKIDIHRILDNLVSNATKYGDPLKPVILTLKGDHDSILLTVHNFGEPIPPEKLEDIFDAFHRLEAPTDKRKQGWGIGLALARGRVEAHGGKIWVTSNAKEGTTFHVKLPRDARE